MIAAVDGLLDGNIDVDIDSLSAPKKLIDCIELHNTYDYTKGARKPIETSWEQWDKQDKEVTGHVIDASRMDNIIIFDFDHFVNQNEFDNVVITLDEEGYIVEKTPSGKGLHVFVNEGTVKLPQNRVLKCNKDQTKYELDLFQSVNYGVGQFMVSCESKVKYEDGHIGQSSWITADALNHVVDKTADDLLELLDIELVMPEPKPKTDFHYENQQTYITSEQLLNVIENFKGVTIHKTQAGPITERISQFVIKCALAGFGNDEVIDKVMDRIKEIANVTPRALNEWDNWDNITPSSVLCIWDMLHIERPPQPISTPEEDKVCDDVLNSIPDEIVTPDDGRLRRVNVGEFLSYNIKHHDDETIPFELLNVCLKNAYHLNCVFSMLGSNKVEIIAYKDLPNLLRTCGFTGKKLRAAIDGVMMNSVEHNEVSFKTLYNGWKYESCVKSNDYEQNIKDFKDCVLLNTCNNDIEFYDFTMKRLSYILHHPGEKSRVCVVYQGLQGTGKNWYEDIICELFDNYSCSNADLPKLTSRFNASCVIGRAYIVCNEALNMDGMFSIKEGIKKLITESKAEVESKGINPFITSNTCNIDITTNNTKPVLIDPEDRRFAIIRTNPEHQDDRDYWRYYQEEVIKRETFHGDVFRYIYDECYDEHFPSLPIPNTEARRALIRLCLSSTNKFCIKYIADFEIGFTRKQLKQCIEDLPAAELGQYKRETFFEEVIGKCKSEYSPHRKTNIYKLAPRFADKLYALMDDDEDDDEETEEENVSIEDIVKHGEGFDYVFATDVTSQAIKTMLINAGFEYKSHISRSKKSPIPNRGYVLKRSATTTDSC